MSCIHEPNCAECLMCSAVAFTKRANAVAELITRELPCVSWLPSFMHKVVAPQEPEHYRQRCEYRVCRLVAFWLDA